MQKKKKTSINLLKKKVYKNIRVRIKMKYYFKENFCIEEGKEPKQVGERVSVPLYIVLDRWCNANCRFCFSGIRQINKK